MKKSKLVNCQQNGMFKELYKFELEFENADIGNIYKKSDSSGLTIGEEYEFTINDKGTIKIQTEFLKNQTYDGNNVSYSYEEKDAKIIKQSCLKAAATFHQQSRATPEDVIKTASKFVEYINGKQNENDPMKILLENKETLSNGNGGDMPF